MCGATISKSFTVAPTNAANHTALPSFMVVNAYIYICYINNCMEIHAVWGDVGNICWSQMFACMFKQTFCLTLVFSPQMVLGILCPLVDGSIWCQDPKKARDVCEY